MLIPTSQLSFGELPLEIREKCYCLVFYRTTAVIKSYHYNICVSDDSSGDSDWAPVANTKIITQWEAFIDHEPRSSQLLCAARWAFDEAR